MILLRTFRREDEVWVNPDLFRTIEPRTGQTLVTLTTGETLNVEDSVEEILERVVEFRARILQAVNANS